MALRNITNNNKNFLFKKKQAPKMKENELIKIESLTCSPSSKKKISSSGGGSYNVRTSSPINYHQQQINSAAIAQIKTLNQHHHESRKQSSRHERKYSNSRSRSSKNERKLSSKCNGMLKVALYNNCGLMTVHGKCLKNKKKRKSF